MIEWDEEHKNEECNARRCNLYNHRGWPLRKQKQVGSLTPRIVSLSDLALPIDTGMSMSSRCG